MSKEKSIIHIDIQEKDPRVLHLFDDQELFEVIIEHLPLGDIQFDNLIIERKSAADFLQSVIKDRFWMNLSDMKANFRNYLLWIDASSDDLMKAMGDSCKRNYKYAYEKYVGSKAEITLMNIPIVEFDKIENAADFFIRLFLKIERGKNGHNAPQGIKKSGIPLEQRRLQALSRVEGIGTGTAAILLAEYNTIENIIQESKKQETKSMKRIWELFCTNKK